MCDGEIVQTSSGFATGLPARATRQFANPNSEGLLGSFDADWRAVLDKFFQDDVADVKDAINSIVSLRNRIAHGTPVPVTYRHIHEYYSRVRIAVDQVAGICAV